MADFDPVAFAEAMKRAPDRLAAIYLPMLVRRSREFRQNILVKNRLSGRPGLIRRSGDLARSFKAIPEGDVSNQKMDGFTLTEYSTSSYANTHEYGAVITPKRGLWLAIPIGDAKTASGVKRAGPRSYANTFVRTSKAGNRIIFQRLADGTVRPLFLLRRSVTIPPRLGYFAEWNNNQSIRRADLAKAVNLVLDTLGQS